MTKICSLLIALLALLAVSVPVWSDYSDIITFSTTNAGKIPFSHEKHLAAHNNNCSACHNSIFHVKRAKNPVFTMADMEKGKSCGSCHNKENPRIPQLDACTRCHPVSDVAIASPGFGSVVFSHGKHLGAFTCSDCHDSIFRTTHDNPHYSMAQMEQGKSCGSCHDGKSAFSVKGDCVKCHQVKDIPLTGDTLFSHKLHLEMSFSCGDCHGKLFTTSSGRRSYTMAEMEKGKSCGGCHDGKTAFSVKGDCQKCHKGAKDVAFKGANALFSHGKHLKQFSCGDCHSSLFVGGSRSIRHTMPQMEKGESCGACHDGKSAFGVTGSCGRCHVEPPRDVTFSIKDAGKVVFSHNSHRSLFKCDDCHNPVFTTGVAARRFTMADMAKGSSCGACHDGKTAFGVTRECSKCHPVKDILFTDDARFSHMKHLDMHTCTDCHTRYFSADTKNRRHTMAEMEKGQSCGGCHDGKNAFSAAGDCNKCHNSTVTVTYNVKETGPVRFSHSAHSSLFGCSDCHNKIFIPGKGSRRFTMAEMEKGQSCGTCHDGKTAFGVKDSCTRCHPVKQINFKPGSAVFNHTTHLSAFTCKDCHVSIYEPARSNKPVSMANMERGKSCGSCHDGSTAFSVKGDCQKCHPGSLKTVRYELPATTGHVEFSHKFHTGKGYSCVDCHYTIMPSGSPEKRWVMKEMDQGKFCGSCHGFSMAFSVKDPQSCERCHIRELQWRQPAQY